LRIYESDINRNNGLNNSSFWTRNAKVENKENIKEINKAFSNMKFLDLQKELHIIVLCFSCIYLLVRESQNNK